MIKFSKSMLYLFCAYASAVVLMACAAAQKDVKTIDNAAIILCDVFFSQQHPEMSVPDIEKAFCSAANDIAPFLESAKAASRAGGLERTQGKDSEKP